MKRLFADSFFFFAYLNAEDGAHEAAEQYFEGFGGNLVTTEWVLTEVADGMAGVRDRETFSDFHEALRSDPAVTVIPASPELFAEGLALLKQEGQGMDPDRLHFICGDEARAPGGGPHGRSSFQAGWLLDAAGVTAGRLLFLRTGQGGKSNRAGSKTFRLHHRWRHGKTVTVATRTRLGTDLIQRDRGVGLANRLGRHAGCMGRFTRVASSASEVREKQIISTTARPFHRARYPGSAVAHALRRPDCR